MRTDKHAKSFETSHSQWVGFKPRNLLPWARWQFFHRTTETSVEKPHLITNQANTATNCTDQINCIGFACKQWCRHWFNCNVMSVNTGVTYGLRQHLQNMSLECSVCNGSARWVLTCCRSSILRRSPSVSMLCWLVLACSSEMVCFCWEQWMCTSCREERAERSFSSKEDKCSCCSEETGRRREMVKTLKQDSAVCGKPHRSVSVNYIITCEMSINSFWDNIQHDKRAPAQSTATTKCSKHRHELS